MSAVQDAAATASPDSRDFNRLFGTLLLLVITFQMFRFKSHILWIILEGFWFKFSETPVKTLFLLTSLSGPGSRSGVFSLSGALGTTSQLFSRADPRRFRSAQIQQHEKIRSPQGHPDRPGPKLCREAGPCLNAAPLAVGRGGERAHSAGEGALGAVLARAPFPSRRGGVSTLLSLSVLTSGHS